MEGRSSKSTVTGSLQVCIGFDLSQESLVEQFGEPEYLVFQVHSLKGLQNFSKNEKFTVAPDGTLQPIQNHDMKDIGARKCPLTKAREGVSDPYVLLELGDNHLRSDTYFDNRNPEIKEYFAFAIAPGATLDFSMLKVTVWDFNDPFDVDECMGRVNISLTDVAQSVHGNETWVKINPPPRKQYVSCNILYGSPAKQKDTIWIPSTSDRAVWRPQKDESVFECPLTDYDDMFNFTLRSRQERMIASGSLKILWDEDTRGVMYSYADIHGNPV